MKESSVKRKFNVKKFILFIIVIFIIIGLIIGGLFFFSLSPVSKSTESYSFEVASGTSTNEVFESLEEANLIRSAFTMKIYSKLIGGVNVDAGTYNFNENMGTVKILKMFKDKKYSNGEEVPITFKEGITIPTVVSLISENTGTSEDEIYSLLKDKEYLKSLIDEYWFLDESILNDKIYYSLEGYLYPETYFVLKSMDAKDIINIMLRQTDKVLSKYKTQLESSKYSVHEILTLASIIEKESLTEEDRTGVSSVFYNRLNAGDSLGSDVTTYYGAKVNLYERDLYQKEIDEVNDYNTRSSSMAGKLPVSPICNPSESSINAALNPIESDYYYFVSDKNGKIYFAKDYSEHASIINELKSQDLWLVY